MKLVIVALILVLIVAGATHLVAYQIVPAYRCGLDNRGLPATMDRSATIMLEKTIAADPRLPKISSVMTRGIIAHITSDSTNVTLRNASTTRGIELLLHELAGEWEAVVQRRFPKILSGCSSITLENIDGHVLAHSAPHLTLW